MAINEDFLVYKRRGIPGFSLKSSDKKSYILLLVCFRLCLESKPTPVLIIYYADL